MARKSKPLVLFVCTANMCRSPMMEQIFRAYAQRQGFACRVGSAGIYAEDGHAISPNSATVLAEMGLPRRKHRAKLLTSKLINRADLVVTATSAHARLIGGSEKVVFFASLTGGNELDDPYGGSLDSYRKCAQYIEFGCPDVLAYLQKLLARTQK